MGIKTIHQTFLQPKREQRVLIVMPNSTDKIPKEYPLFKVDRVEKWWDHHKLVASSYMRLKILSSKCKGLVKLLSMCLRTELQTEDRFTTSKIVQLFSTIRYTTVWDMGEQLTIIKKVTLFHKECIKKRRSLSSLQLSTQTTRSTTWICKSPISINLTGLTLMSTATIKWINSLWEQKATTTQSGMILIPF